MKSKVVPMIIYCIVGFLAAVAGAGIVISLIDKISFGEALSRFETWITGVLGIVVVYFVTRNKNNKS